MDYISSHIINRNQTSTDSACLHDDERYVPDVSCSIHTTKELTLL